MPRKTPKLKHIKHTRAHGRDYYYFDTGKTKTSGAKLYTPLPDPASMQFGGAYASALASRTKRAQTEYTVAKMAREYQGSATFANLAENTRKAYNAQLPKIIDHWGDFPVDKLEPSYVREVIEASAWATGTSNAVTAVLGALYTWGRKNAKASVVPTKDIGRVKPPGHPPWPEDVLTAGLAASDGLVRLAVHVMYFTGLRIGDALKLRWRDIGDDGVITVIPQKTSHAKDGPKTLYIPLSAELKVELDATPKRTLTILPRTNSAEQELTQARLRKDLQAFTRALGVETVPHGLRKNAVNSLLLAGCSIAETAAITGQTYQVVEHYAAQINRRKLAGAAIVKLDDSRRKGG